MKLSQIETGGDTMKKIITFLFAVMFVLHVQVTINLW